MSDRSALTPQLQAAIVANLELALPIKLAVEAEGVAERTFYYWLERAEEGEEPYASFAAAVTRARAKAAKKLVKKSLAGGKGSSAAAWHLERRFRDDYGPAVAEKGAGEVRIIVEGGLPPRPTG